LKRLARFLKKNKYKVYITKEPGGTSIGRHIRKILLNPVHKGMNSYAELFLYLADRAQHIQEIILPYLNKGYIVLSDRYFDSTTAYQAAGRQISPELVSRLIAMTVKDVIPGLTFVLRRNLSAGLNRAKQLSKEYRGGDRMELESLSFHKKVQQEFNCLVRKYPGRIIAVDISDSIAHTQDRIRALCIKKLNSR
jgi:dTMP kinase